MTTTESIDALQPSLSPRFSELLFEIVYRIIEILLEIAPKRAYELLTLSRSLRVLAEKSLYRYIILTRQLPFDLFVDALRSNITSSPGRWVESLCITSRVELDATELLDLRTIFSACPNLQSIAIAPFSASSPPEAVLDALASSGPRPTRLRCSLNWVQRCDGGPRLDLPLFHNLTHLQIWDGKGGFRAFTSTYLHSLTKLTHLSFVVHETQLVLLSRRMSLGASIVVCFIFVHRLEQTPDDSHIQAKCARFTDSDPRVVFSLSGELPNPERYGNVLWEDIKFRKRRRGGRRREDDVDVRGHGDRDMWEKAEAIAKSPGKPVGLYRFVETPAAGAL